MAEEDIMLEVLTGQAKRWETELGNLKEQESMEDNEINLKEINRKIMELDLKILEYNSRISALKMNSY
jgi:hypothetical protein